MAGHRVDRVKIQRGGGALRVLTRWRAEHFAIFGGVSLGFSPFRHGVKLVDFPHPQLAKVPGGERQRERQEETENGEQGMEGRKWARENTDHNAQGNQRGERKDDRGDRREAGKETGKEAGD